MQEKPFVHLLGLLPFQKLIHSVGPKWMGGEKNEQFVLCSAVHNSLCVANKENLHSIALPAIGTGVYAVPIGVCAEESHRAVEKFCIYHPSACVKDIRFVLYTKAHAQEFLKCFEKLVKENKQHSLSVAQASAAEQCLSTFANCYSTITKLVSGEMTFALTHHTTV